MFLILLRCEVLLLILLRCEVLLLRFTKVCGCLVNFYWMVSHTLFSYITLFIFADIQTKHINICSLCFVSYVYHDRFKVLIHIIILMFV